MPNVTIEWLQGRSLDQKRKVIAGITDLLVDVADARREAVQVTFIDMSKEDWGRGGLLGIDRTDVRFVAEPPAELLACGTGRDAKRIEEVVSWLDRRAADPRIVSMRVALPAARWTRTIAVVGVVLVAAATFVGLWLRRRRSRSG